VGFVLAASGVALAATVVVLTASLGMFWASALARLHRGAERTGVDQGHGFAVYNLAWAGGQMVGASAGGALAALGGPGVPLGLFAAGVLLLGVRIPRERSASAPERGGGVPDAPRP
jgi:hypothetical protein